MPVGGCGEGDGENKVFPIQVSLECYFYFLMRLLLLSKDENIVSLWMPSVTERYKEYLH